MPMVSVERLTKFYGPKRAVHDLNFEVEEGEIVGLLGLNGSGKTTVLRILSGTLLPTAGHVKIRGLDFLERPLEIRSLLGFLPETPPLYGEMTVRAYLSFVAELRGLTRREVMERLPVVEEETRIADVRDETISNLSFGYRQRVGIAQAIIHLPELLILDEPVSGLDPVQIVEMRQMIKAFRGNHTVLLSSHYLSEISQICDRILVIQDGEIVGQGTEEELAGQCALKQRLTLEVRGEKGELFELLDSIGAVENVEVLQEEGKRISCALELVSDAREEISRALVEKGFGLLGLGRSEMELESIFMRLMERDGEGITKEEGITKGEGS